MIKERPLAGVIAGGKDFLFAGHPDSEGKAANEVIEASSAPAKPGGHQEGRVGEFLGASEAEFPGQVGAVVQPHIRHKAGGAGAAPEWLKVEAVLGERGKDINPESNTVVTPSGLAIPTVLLEG